MPQYGSPAEIYSEMASLSPKFAGISHDRIEVEGGLQWPCEASDHPGTPTLHGAGPLKGKAEFQPVAYRPSLEQADSEWPFVLSTGRTLYHYNAATQTRRDSGPAIKQPDNFVEVHPRDARRLGIEDGEQVAVSSRRGTVMARTVVTRKMRRGCIWMPLHFAENMANQLTNDQGDPVTGTAEYKVCAARIDKL
jgi:predicted molibdopterin-dependent oxidoreductase YjgC